MADDSQGAQAQLAMEPLASPHTWDTSSEPYEFIREEMRKVGRTIGTDGIRGTRSDPKERTREGAYACAGHILMNPSPATLDLLLPRILGAAESMDTFAVAETLPTFGVLVDRVGEVFEYKDCYVNWALFRGRARQLTGNVPRPIELILHLIAKDETAPASGPTFPALTLGTASNYAPYMFEEGTFNLVGSDRDTLAFELLINNHLQPRWGNSKTPTSITPRKRTISLKTLHPYTSAETDLYSQAIAGTASSYVDFTNGNLSTRFNFGVLQVPDHSPYVPGKTSVPLELFQVARKTGATEDISVTNDSVD